MSEKRVTVREVYSSLKQNKPWLIFALNILFMWTGYFIQTGALVYYFQVVIGSTTLSVTVATIMSVVSMIANFFVPFLASKMGKRNLYIVSSIVQLLGCALIFLAGNHSLEILIGAVVSGLGYGIKRKYLFFYAKRIR